MLRKKVLMVDVHWAVLRLGYIECVVRLLRLGCPLMYR